MRTNEASIKLSQLPEKIRRLVNKTPNCTKVRLYQTSNKFQLSFFFEKDLMLKGVEFYSKNINLKPYESSVQIHEELEKFLKEMGFIYCQKDGNTNIWETTISQ